MLVVTYNIQSGRGRDNVIDLKRIARTIADADVIALQEVERDWSPSRGDQVAALAALFPRHFWSFGVAVDVNGGSINPDGTVNNIRRQYGNMTLSRWPIVSVRSWSLPKQAVYGTVNDQSMLLETVIRHPAMDFRFYNTHLNYLMQDQRLAQLEQVMRIMWAAPGEGGVVAAPGASKEDIENDDWPLMKPDEVPTMPNPAILMGDFNFEPGSLEWKMALGGPDPIYKRGFVPGKLADALTIAGQPEDKGITFPASGGEPAQRIDHCFLTFDLIEKVRRGWIDDDADGSDHQPVWAEFDL